MSKSSIVRLVTEVRNDLIRVPIRVVITQSHLAKLDFFRDVIHKTCAKDFPVHSYVLARVNSYLGTEFTRFSIVTVTRLTAVISVSSL